MLPFQRIYVLNQYHRKDRLLQLKEEMDRVDEERFQVIYAIDGETPFHSFCRSQANIIQHFVDSGAENCLIVEDDVQFGDLSILDAAIKEMPDDWLTLHLGANISEGVAGIKENQPQAYSKHLARLRCAWTTHAVAYRRPVAEMIALSYNPETRIMYDQWLSENILGGNPCFICRPMVAWQRPGKSDLWGVQTDYSNAWKLSDQKLAAL